MENHKKILEHEKLFELFNTKIEQMDLAIAECQDLVTHYEDMIEGFAEEIVRIDAMYRSQMRETRIQIYRVIFLLKKLNIHRKEKTFEEIQKEVDREMRMQGLNPDDDTWERKVDWFLQKDSVRYDSDITQAKHKNKRI
jgi:predicted RNase H-like nuclease (RuvC/YqgF family)